MIFGVTLEQMIVNKFSFNISIFFILLVWQLKNIKNT